MPKRLARTSNGQTDAQGGASSSRSGGRAERPKEGRARRVVEGGRESRTAGLVDAGCTPHNPGASHLARRIERRSNRSKIALGRFESEAMEERGRRFYPLATTVEKPRVLLAEDDYHMRRLLAYGLKRDGFEVIEASNGAELVQKIESLVIRPGNRRTVDLIISDIRMPFAGGLTVLALLRLHDWATPVILITAFGDAETHLEADRLGAAAVFDKPFDVNDLRTSALHFAGGM